jgi:SAM-dependent methyltransferase
MSSYLQCVSGKVYRHMDKAHSGGDVTGELPHIRGNREIQHDVLVALAECANHRRWFAGFAKPYLGDCPMEIGSGLGDYAREWIPLVSSFTATDADPVTVLELKQAMAAFPQVTVSEVALPAEDRAEHSCVIAYNVLEHIEDDIDALRSMARLLRPGGHVVLVTPAFPFAMSPVDIATGHVRRYTKRTMRAALSGAGLEIVDVRYANSLGLLCYYAFTSLLRRTPSEGGTMSLYDKVVVPIVRFGERIIGRPPFGQSVIAVAKVTGPAEPE